MNSRFLILLVLLTSCVSVANISNLPQGSYYIDFDKYSNEYQEENIPFWTTAGSNEYYFEKNFTVKDDLIFDIISEALLDEGYKIVVADNKNQFFTGKRGIRLNEWNSRIGVYYKINVPEFKTQVFIRVDITQDITGGWKENRAKKVGEKIEYLL